MAECCNRHHCPVFEEEEVIKQSRYRCRERGEFVGYVYRA